VCDEVSLVCDEVSQVCDEVSLVCDEVSQVDMVPPVSCMVTPAAQA